MQIAQLRSYRATLVPPGTDQSEAETLADKKLLPVIRLKAKCCQSAARAANYVTGKQVLRTERVEGGAA